MKWPVLWAAILTAPWAFADETVENGLLDPWTEEREIEVKLEDLKGHKLVDFKLTGATPEEAFIVFFSRVRDELKMDFGPEIKEPENPMSLRVRELRNRKKIRIEWKDAEASVIFRSLMDMTMWHWRYGERGQIVIHAWHLGDIDEPDPDGE